MRGARRGLGRADGLQIGRRLEPRRRQRDVGEGHRRLDAPSTRTRGARPGPPRPPGPRPARPLVLVAPAPVLSAGAQAGPYPDRRCHPNPACSPAVPGTPPRCRPRGATTRSTPGRTPRRRPTPRSPRCASAARPATTASRARLAGYERRRRRPAARAPAAALGAAPGPRRRARLAVRRSASCAAPTAAGWPAAARLGGVVGRPLGARRRRRGRGRRGPGRRRSCASSRRSGRSRPARLAVEALVRLPNRPGDADRPGLAARRRRGRARPRARRATRGGRADPEAWPDEADPRCGAMADAAAVGVTVPAGEPTRSAADHLQALKTCRSPTRRSTWRCWRSGSIPGPARRRDRARAGRHGIGWIVMSLLCLIAAARRASSRSGSRVHRRGRRRHRPVRRERSASSSRNATPPRDAAEPPVSRRNAR